MTVTATARAASAGAAALLLLALASSGCTLLRAEVGVGLGLGVNVKVPALLHVGLGAGEFTNRGPHYQWTSHATFPSREIDIWLLFWHWEGRRGVLTAEEAEARRRGLLSAAQEAAAEARIWPQHACFGILPPLTTYAGDGDRGRDAWSLEIGLMLLFVDFRLGFNPLGFVP